MIPYILAIAGGYLIGNSSNKKFYRGGITPKGVDYTIDFYGDQYKYSVSSQGYTFTFVSDRLLSIDEIEKKFDSIFDDMVEQMDITKHYDYIYKKGGKVQYSIEKGNNLMLKNKIREVDHHAKELKRIVKDNTKVDAWVVAKAERSASDLSDITHYLDGVTRYYDGGEINEFYKDLVTRAVKEGGFEIDVFEMKYSLADGYLIATKKYEGYDIEFHVIKNQDEDNSYFDIEIMVFPPNSDIAEKLNVNEFLNNNKSDKGVTDFVRELVEDLKFQLN